MYSSRMLYQSKITTSNEMRGAQMSSLWSLVAQQVVVMTTICATSDSKVDIVTVEMRDKNNLSITLCWNPVPQLILNMSFLYIDWNTHCENINICCGNPCMDMMEFMYWITPHSMIPFWCKVYHIHSICYSTLLNPSSLKFLSRSWATHWLFS